MMTSMVTRKRSQCNDSDDSGGSDYSKRPRLQARRLLLVTRHNAERGPASDLANADQSPQNASINGPSEFVYSMIVQPSLRSSADAVPSCPPSTESAKASLVRFLDSYEILHDGTDNQQQQLSGLEFEGQKPNETFLVRQFNDGVNGQESLGLCRRISYEKYTRYIELYRRFTAPTDIEDEQFEVEIDYDRDAVFRRLWPDGCRLFSVQDPISKRLAYYIHTPRHHGSLHVYVVDQKKLAVDEALGYFRQIVETVAFCHARGIVLRDVKLRKFVFADSHRSSVRFCDLDEFYLLDDPSDDAMRERNGCPAYVSPEIIDFRSQTYAGKPADVWGLGILLYVMMVGRYPFYDTTPLGLFLKIRAAKLPLSERAASAMPPALRYALRCLLNKLASDRPTAADLLRMPWWPPRDFSARDDDVTRAYCRFSYDDDDVIDKGEVADGDDDVAVENDDVMEANRDVTDENDVSSGNDDVTDDDDRSAS